MRQTVSKWERGLSVPDSEMLIALGDALNAPVSALLGEAVGERKPDDIAALAEKLELVNLQLARMRDARRRVAHRLFIGLAAFIALTFVALAAVGGSYLGWDLSDPETAVASTMLHGFEWLFVRAAPILLIGSVAGIFATRSR